MYSPQSEYKPPGAGSPTGAEPMTLGSPAASPSASQTNINYLPPYLIGDMPSQSSPSSPSVGGWSSPAKHTVSFSTPRMSPGPSRKALYQSPVPPSSTLINSPAARKPGAPPVEGLSSTLTPHRGFSKFQNDETLSMNVPSLSITEPSFREHQQTNGVLTPSISFNGSVNNSNFMSPAQIDPFYTQGESLTPNTKLDETWVTVFGFPPAATNYILQQFSQYGRIIEHKLATSGNWISIRYQSKLQAKKALSKNGKIFGGNMMVGVKPCIEIDVMNESGKENTSVADATANFCQENVDGESFDSGKRSLANIRPLTQIYRTPSSEAEVSAKSESKSSNLVTRAIEYVFKW